MEPEKITLITVCDDRFVILLAALIKSIEVNHKTAEPVDLYIIEDKVSNENKEKLRRSINTELISIHWLAMSEVIPRGTRLPLNISDFPLNVYVRLFIPHFIPQHLEKVIYLDVDMIMLEDISRLWHIGTGGHIIAGVPDRSQVVSHWMGIMNYKELGLNPQTKYYNSGLLIIDNFKWRASDITNKILKCIDENKRFTHFPDQYGLNVVLADQWLELDAKWNCYANSDEEHPYLIHFIVNKPIYKTYSYNEEYKKKFYYYLNLTEWKGFEPVNQPKRYLAIWKSKLMKKMYKILDAVKLR